jgi:CBS domain-containing protein
MRIADILAMKGSTVATVTGEATVTEAVAALARHSVGALVVSPDGEHIEGIVSERDIVRLLHREHTGLLEHPVRDIMSTPVHTCGADAAVDDVMTTMTLQRVRHVPVTRDGVLCGIVSIGDVVKSTIEQLQLDRKLLEDYITAR